MAAVLATGDRSLKAQMRKADAAGAAYVAIIGRKELETDSVVLRRMADGQQEQVAFDQVVSILADPAGL